MSTFNYMVIPKTNVLNPKGDKIYYAVASRGKKYTTEELCKEISHSSTLTEIDIRANIFAMIYILKSKLVNGDIVELTDLGSFCMNIHSKGVDIHDDFTVDKIRGVRIRFRPLKSLSKIGSTIDFHRVEQLIPISKVPLTPPNP